MPWVFGHGGLSALQPYLDLHGGCMPSFVIDVEPDSLHRRLGRTITEYHVLFVSIVCGVYAVASTPIDQKNDY